ncbi:MAG: exodeoxyribonuclease VII small subunit [Rhodobacterales bacterium]|nr:exodeoxyribonuclease VII small subunit [Rhodobacterales bacterium]
MSAGKSKADAAPSDVDGMSFEDALAELEDIVRRLEDGSGKLDEAISAYERGARLKAHCEARLREAQARIDRVVVAADGGARVEDMDIE